MKRGLEIKKQILSTGNFDINSPEYAAAIESRKGEILGVISSETRRDIDKAIAAEEAEGGSPSNQVDGNAQSEWEPIN